MRGNYSYTGSLAFLENTSSASCCRVRASCLLRWFSSWQLRPCQHISKELKQHICGIV